MNIDRFTGLQSTFSQDDYRTVLTSGIAAMVSESADLYNSWIGQPELQN
jgi:hypothetical protein